MLAVPAAIGFLNGYAVAYLRMVPFVVTLATMSVVGGATVVCSPSILVGLGRHHALSEDGRCKPFAAAADGFGVIGGGWDGGG